MLDHTVSRWADFTTYFHPGSCSCGLIFDNDASLLRHIIDEREMLMHEQRKKKRKDQPDLPKMPTGHVVPPPHGFCLRPEICDCMCVACMATREGVVL